MRIVAGEYRGRRLKAPSWDGLRPTSDKLRETLFNILAPRIEGARVLDAYAGTGAVGLEALSRGAAHVNFLEQDRRALALIEENARLCGAQGRYTIDSGDAAAWLRRATATFDLIFMDPPYDEPPAGSVLESAGRRLNTGGLLVLERASRREPAEPAALARVRDVKSGDSVLTFFTWPPERGAVT
jgi:16S rRNA (guanine966-N2)-methyltransferase